jgi:transcriptional regulator with GAF, ATPase, and Fis domain
VTCAPVDLRAVIMDGREVVTFAEVVRELLEEPSEPTTMQAVAASAVTLIPACDHAGITLRGKGRRLTTAASTSPLVDDCDALQYELGEGPCLSAVFTDEAYLVEDTSADHRWPSWGPRAAARGAWSVMSVRLFTRGHVLGALNMYAEKPYRFTADDVDLAVLYAAHAATALRTAREMSGLQIAVESRHLIGIAQGIMMNRYGLDQSQSFDVLRRYSSQTNTKLRDVARFVIETGKVPGEDDVPRRPAEDTTARSTGTLRVQPSSRLSEPELS